jgi:hypothetical protein
MNGQGKVSINTNTFSTSELTVNGSVQATSATLTSFTTAGLVTTTASGVLGDLANDSAYSVLQMNSGATSPAWVGLSTIINSTNLQITSNVINTIQNINTSASPSFTNLTLTGYANIAGGLEDANVTTPIHIGDASDTTFETVNQTIIGSSNEIHNILGSLTSSGVYSFAGTTVTGSTTFTIAPATGWIISNTDGNASVPIITPVSYAGVVNTTTPYLSTADATYLLITSSSTLLMQTSFPTPAQRRSNIYIGKIVHPNRTSIQGVDETTDFVQSPMSVIRDMFVPIKYVNAGISFYANGANLNLNETAGNLYGVGLNFTAFDTNPDMVSISAGTAVQFYYRTQAGGTTGLVSAVSPGYYDVGGTVTAIVGPPRYTNQRIFIFPTGVINIQYGQTLYTSMALALAGLPNENFVLAPNSASTGFLVGVIAIASNATALNNTAQATFVPVSKFGEITNAANGTTTATMQQIYNNSVIPEIITSTGIGAVVYQNGLASDTSAVFEIENIAGSVTASITGAGVITGSDLVLTGLTGNNVITSTDITTDLGNIDNAYNIINDPTGFDNPNNVVISYNSATQIVTLSGSPWQGYYNGKKVTALSSATGYTSTAHPNTTGHFYWLSYSPSTDFQWTQDSFPGFNFLLIALVDYQSTYSFGCRESHGMMAWVDHQEMHQTIGTYNAGGGVLSGYTTGSTTAANRRPVVSACSVKDEDLTTTNAAITTNSYTQFFLTSTGVNNFTTAATDIVPLSTVHPYYNQFTAGAWTQTLMAASSYMSIWLVGLPVDSDTNSQLYRFLWVQGQANNTTLTTEQALTSSSVNLGTLTSELPEYVFLARVIINYTPGAGGNWTIEEVDTITGTRISQSSTSGSISLTVSTDASLSGNGSSALPLSALPLVTDTSGLTTTNFTNILTGNTNVDNNIQQAFNDIDSNWATYPLIPGNVNVQSNFIYLPFMSGITNNGYAITINAGAEAVPLPNFGLGFDGNLVQILSSTFSNILNPNFDNTAQQAFINIDQYYGTEDMYVGNVVVQPCYNYSPTSGSITSAGKYITINNGAVVYTYPNVAQGTIEFNYNPANLQVNAIGLDTIQNISTTASPTFANLTVTTTITGNNITLSGALTLSGLVSNNMITGTSVIQDLQQIDSYWLSQPQVPNNLTALANWTMSLYSGGETPAAKAITVNAGGIVNVMPAPGQGYSASTVQTNASTFANILSPTIDLTDAQAFIDIDQYYGTMNTTGANIVVQPNWDYVGFSGSTTNNGNTITVNNGSIAMASTILTAQNTDYNSSPTFANITTATETTGALIVNPTGAYYNEGILINRAADGFAVISMGSPQGTTGGPPPVELLYSYNGGTNAYFSINNVFQVSTNGNTGVGSTATVPVSLLSVGGNGLAGAQLYSTSATANGYAGYFLETGTTSTGVYASGTSNDIYLAHGPISSAANIQLIPASGTVSIGGTYTGSVLNIGGSSTASTYTVFAYNGTYSSGYAIYGQSYTLGSGVYGTGGVYGVAGSGGYGVYASGTTDDLYLNNGTLYTPATNGFQIKCSYTTLSNPPAFSIGGSGTINALNSMIYAQQAGNDPAIYGYCGGNGTSTYAVYGLSGYGGVYGNGTTWDFVAANSRVSGFSSIREKENITTIPNALDTITKLNGVTYNWTKAHADRTGSIHNPKTQYGFVSEHLGQVIPTAVEYEADLPENYYVDTDGNKKLGVRAMDLIAPLPILVEAVKELNAKVIAQQEIITDLQNKIALLVK